MLWWYMMRGGCLHRVFSSPHQGALNISSNFNSIPASYSLLCCYIFLKWRMTGCCRQESFPPLTSKAWSCQGLRQLSRVWAGLGTSRMLPRKLVTCHGMLESQSRECRDPGQDFYMIHAFLGHTILQNTTAVQSLSDAIRQSFSKSLKSSISFLFLNTSVMIVWPLMPRYW